MSCRARIRSLFIPALLAASFLSPASAAAQMASPALTARIQGVNSEEAQSRKLRIATLDIEVQVHGIVAETTITARFANAGPAILEGDFRLMMPANSVVTGYALDVNGGMVEGVLVDQRQGRIAYEARVRQRIDPGLAEVNRDNLFRTRVFPIFPGSGRTIRLRFTSPLDPRAGYVLPIRESEEIGAFSLRLEASGLTRPPAVELPLSDGGRWSSEGPVHHLELRRSDVRLDGDLSIAATATATPMLVSRHSNGERFFQIVDQVPPRREEAPRVQTAAIFWDRSLSRADDNLDEEIAILQQYLERVRPEAIDLILFDSAGADRIRATSTQDLVRRLRAVRYRGATSLGVLGNQAVRADACLLFTDGLVTIDPREGFRPDCPLFAMSSAADADRRYLASLAGSSGGEAYDLTVREAGEVLTRMTRRVPRVIDVRSSGGARVEYSLLDGGEYGWRIVGRMPATGDVIVRLSGLPSGPAERVYSAAGPIMEMDGPGTLWAADRVAQMAASDDRDRDELVAFSRSYSVASPDVSFIVLETGRDYAMARFEPPASLPAELLDEYRRVREQMKETETTSRSRRLETVLAQWREMREWWATRFDPARRPTRRRGDGQPMPESGPVPVTTAPLPSPPPPLSPPPPPPPPSPTAPPAPPVVSQSTEALTAFDASEDAAIAVTGSRVEPARGRGRGSRGSIAIEPWKADRPYLAALNAAHAADLERVFAEQQAEHGALPAFWLDVADWAFRKGRRADAIQLVLSALELPTRNNQTLSIVADRLMRYGEIDRAIWLYERLLAAEDDRPQPQRTLALALAKRAETAPREQAQADLARALSLLTEVVMTPWDVAYEGIELISLMEANRLIPRYRALGGRTIALDERLIALLDVDLRVVIEWNSEATDIDLWVDEPTGERAIYHNPRTALGGRLSNDMTSGFGPEEYLLRRAIPGTYEVRANVFAADRLNPNGAQRVTARIIRDFGRPNETEEVVDIELLPNDQTRERRVGRVTFGR